MKLVVSVSAVVLILGIAGAAVVLASRDGPRNGSVQVAQATPASGAQSAAAAVAAIRPASSAPAPAFTPPPDSAIPDDEFGKEVRLGQAIFNGTSPDAAAFVGNSLRCASCHLDAGRLADSAPLWGAYVAYPAYRSKNSHVTLWQSACKAVFATA